MHWVSYAQAADDMAEWAMREPVLREAAAFIGVPRSGLLLANMLALHLNKHLLPLPWLWRGDSVEPLRRGSRGMGPGHVVVIEDSVLTGATLRQLMRRVKDSGPHRPVRFAAAYVRADTPGLFPGLLYARVIPRYAAFAWNWAHQRRLEQAVLDMDGVLFPMGAAIDELDAVPLVVPTYAPLAIATGRREKYRAATLAWLRRWGIPTRTLHMMPTDKDAHATVGGVVGHKSSVAKALGALWFVESEADQSADISTAAGIPVLCTADWRLYAGGRPRG
jgi:hypothetical protein